MFDIICVTSRLLCHRDFLEQIKSVCQTHPKCIILREKDLSEDNYRLLVRQVRPICRGYGVDLVLHSFWNVAAEFGIDKIHLPLHILQNIDKTQLNSFTQIGASCHSEDEARQAVDFGVTYITAGHIFATNCKKGLSPRGTDFLAKICNSVNIPVYAIGGISADNIGLIGDCGAAGACIMSGFMECDNPVGFMEKIRKRI